MKLFLLATVFLTSITYFSNHVQAGPVSCPNFAGQFQLVDPTEKVILNTKQMECTSIEFDYTMSNGDIFAKVYPLNNIRRKTYQDATLIVYETSGINDDALINRVEDFEIATQKTTTAVTHYILDSHNNLSGRDDYYDANGVLYHTDLHQFNRL